MPTLTATSLDRLLEPASGNPTLPKAPPVKLEPMRARSRPMFASSTLYATLTVAPLPLPDSPSSFPPSPYIVNHKRRGPRLQKPPPPLEAEEEADYKDEAKESDFDANLGTTSPVVSVDENNSGNGIAVNEEAEDFLDFMDSMSSASNLEGEDGSAVEGLRKVGTDLGEFYDAFDDKARQRSHHRRNKRKKWFWGSIGLVVTVGSAAIAWSYLPSSNPPVSNDN